MSNRETPFVGWCPSCGRGYSLQANFCANCGAATPAKKVAEMEDEEEIVLPQFGAHMKEQERLWKWNDLLAAPFPKADTTEKILRIAAQVEKEGHLIVIRAQHPVRLRAAEPGEKGDIVAEAADQPPGYKPMLWFYNKENAATGDKTSQLWLCSSDYPFLGSYSALKEEWKKRKQQLQLNALIRAGLMDE